MRKDVAAVTRLANKILNGEEIGCAQEEGYFERGIRRQTWIQMCIRDRRYGIGPDFGRAYV